MFARKPSLPNKIGIDYRKQLEHLYSRRTTINALIESLQQYDRFRATRSPEQNRKSA